MCAIAVLTKPLTACVTETFSAIGAAGALGSAYFDWKAQEKGEPQIVTPDIEDYGKNVQAFAAEELSRLGPPCGRTDIVKGCSVVHRMVIDYGDLRRRIRAAEKD